jgi:hypothetical protein
LPPNSGQTNIHAVIISGLADPAKVIASPNVTLTGGLVALGKANAAGGAVSTWTPGLRIIPDYRLLTGNQNSASDTQHHRRAHRPVTSSGRLSFAE